MKALELHLAGSVLLAFLVMLFINEFIGSMGGIPAFLSFLAAFYIQRRAVLSGGRTSRRLAQDSKKEIRMMLVRYAVIDLFLWTVMKLVVIFSRISGWGNIGGMTAGEYFSHMYGSSMPERWAYLFAVILMFAFVLSLFPLVIIRKRKLWIGYLLADAAFFVAVCVGIAGICRLFIQKELAGRAVCVLDALLLCRPSQNLQIFLYIAGILAFTLLTMLAVYWISCKSYADTAERTSEPAEASERGRRNGKRLLLQGIAGLVCLLLVGLLLGRMLFGSRESQPHYEQAAECLTEDHRFGPMLCGEKIYLPVDRELDYYETGRAVGYLGYKGENCSSRFYELAVANLLYRSAQKNSDYLQMYGSDINSYGLAEKIEADASWKADDVFLLWDEDWESENRYTKDVTGYSICPKEMVLELEEQFREVDYRQEDFSDYDAYFTIRGYTELKEAIKEGVQPGDWVGCILVKDDCFYYGNYDNPITGKSLEMLMSAVGGYGSGVQKAGS